MQRNCQEELIAFRYKNAPVTFEMLQTHFLYESYLLAVFYCTVQLLAYC